MADTHTPSSSFKSKLLRLASSIGPGIFIIGYIIGTGSVTTMATSGAKYGMSMTWALGLSCFFTYVTIVCISRSTIVSGETLLFSIKQKFGKIIAIFVIFGLMMTELTSIMGVMGIATDVVREWTRPLTASGNGIHPIWSALLFTAILYYLFWKGTHGFFLRAMAVIVALMGCSFVLTMFMVIPEPAEIIKGLVPKLPSGGNAHLILAGLVGTTMASVCVVTRSYLVAEKGWTLNDLKDENRDAIISLSLTFLVSAAIIACAAGTMYPRGIMVENAIDMVKTLEPLAGRFATSIFVAGIIAAALSSLFPNYVLAPWLFCDYLNIPRKMDRPTIRIAVFLLASLGIVVPLFGGKPVILMIASQAVSPVVMPLLIVLLFVLLNDKKYADRYKNPLILNTGLIVTFIFSLFISYSAVIGLLDFLKNF
ncbi:MAG: divalent metal cation transporter [Candidatus Latescibacteria bacterium]|nr:divalent metal cation transporter [Candidatus Latescibacterota bacterium]